MTSIKFTDKRGLNEQQRRIHQSNESKKIEEARVDAHVAEELLRQHQAIVDKANKEQEEARIKHAYKGETVKKLDSLRLSFIEDYEEAVAIKMIEDLLGFERPRPVGWWVCVKIYVRDEDMQKIRDKDGRETLLYMPDMVNANDKYKNCSALVLSMGPMAYAHEMFKGTPWCKVGDWVMIARNAGPQVSYRGVPVTFIEDKHIYAVLEDPAHVVKD